MIGSSVKVENISKSFGKIQVLKSVSLNIKGGEFFSLLGPSGCGKTTLLRLIAGFDIPDTGNIYLDEQKVTGLQANERCVNTVFQNYALFPHLTVFDNVAFSLKLKKKSSIFIKEQVYNYLSLVKLSEHAGKMPSQLSGGQKQRVSIARALINEPKVLLLDEPLSALDAKLRQQLLIDLDAIHDEVGITFIYVTHDQQEALGVSDRIAVMNYGDILQIGTSREIYEKPNTEFTANFIGETNLLIGEVTKLLPDNKVIIATQNLGDIVIKTDRELKIKDVVKASLRPESVNVSRDIPSDKTILEIKEGVVDEIIYSGFQSKIFIKNDKKIIIKAFQPHLIDYENDNILKWKDKVFFWWKQEDAYIVEVN